jgi:hypothetical protein
MSSGGGGQPQTTTSQVVLPDWVNTAAQNNIAQAGTVASIPYAADPYATTAQLTPDQLASYQSIRNLQGSTAPAYSAAEGAASGLLSSAAPITADQISGLTTGLMNPYTDAVVNPSVALMGQQLAQTKAGIAANASNVGAFGGSRQGVESGVADSQEALNAAQLKAGLLSSGYTTALGAAQNIANTNLQAGEWATSELPALATGQATEAGKEATALNQIGIQEQAQQQAELGTESAAWQDQRDYPLTQLQINESALQATPYGSTTQTTGTTPSKNVALSALGGAASGAAIGTEILPGWGTAIGAVGGGLLGIFS